MRIGRIESSPRILGDYSGASIQEALLRMILRVHGVGGAHLSRCPVQAAAMQRAGAVHVDLVHILQTFPIHSDDLVP